MKKQVFRLCENAFFCNSTCYVLMNVAQPARRPCNRPGFQHVMYWWMWHNLPDDLATVLHLHRTANYNQRQAFIQVNDVETSETDRTSSGHFLIVFSHSNCSSSSRNLWGSGLSRVERQHHMNTYCVTDGCIVECPRSLCFKTMWAGRNSFKVLQDRSNGTHRDESTYLASSHER